ncbi:MAG TPA: hypothetical protein VH518_16725 [Tepidisphaeraceae bacterium]|jgi:hypothetical protein
MNPIDERILELTEPVPFAELLENSQHIAQTPYGLQDANGVDVTLIQNALKLTADQRVERLYRATVGIINDRARAKRIR